LPPHTGAWIETERRILMAKKVKKAKEKAKVSKQELPPEVKLAKVKAEKKAKEKEAKLTRIQATVQALKEGSEFTKDTLIKESDQVYSKAGGKSNPREAKWVASYVIPCLQAVGMLTEENGVFTLRK
jgi:hypothetical protein